MRRPVWIVVVVAAVLAVGLLALAGCSHKRAESGGPTTEVTPTPSETTPSTETPKTSETAGGDENKDYGYADVLFAYDDASLSEEARQVLSRSAAKLSKNSDKVEVQGHCDERGSVEYNLALGERRAKSAQEYLVSYGIPAARVSTMSYGKERPIDSGHDEAAWARNRRAHFVVR